MLGLDAHDLAAFCLVKCAHKASSEPEIRGAEQKILNCGGGILNGKELIGALAESCGYGRGIGTHDEHNGSRCCPIGDGLFLGQLFSHLFIGDDVEVKVTFPEDYQSEDLKGKDAVFKVKVHKITELEKPELDDEFAKDVSEFDTFAEYRADVEAKILKRHESAAESAFEEAVMKALCEKLAGEEIPEAMFEAECENLLRDYDNRLRMQGLDLNTYFKYTGMTLETMRDQMRPQAESFVKTRLALEKIAELEGITATEEEIEAEYARLAEAYQMEADAVKGMIPAESVAEDLKVKAAMELVKANAVEPAKKPARKPRAKKAKAEETEAPAEAPATEETPAE